MKEKNLSIEKLIYLIIGRKEMRSHHLLILVERTTRYAIIKKNQKQKFQNYDSNFIQSCKRLKANN